MFPANNSYSGMANITSNRTSSITDSQFVFYFLPASQCIPWIVVLVAESLAIVILNIITIIVFVKLRQLQRKSLYLVIHLAVVDLLVGVVSGPLFIEARGAVCNLWEYSFNYLILIKSVPIRLFPMASLANLAAISLERMHATLRPFNHRFIKKRAYCVITTVIWLTAIIREITLFVVALKAPTLSIFIPASLYLAPLLISLFIICMSYISIFVKIRFRPHPNRLRNSVINRERRLTSILFVVVSASLLTMLPWAVLEYFISFNIELLFSRELPASSIHHITTTVYLLVLSNSLVNPIIYAMHMSEFRAGLAAIFHRTPNQLNAAVLPLRPL